MWGGQTKTKAKQLAFKFDWKKKRVGREKFETQAATKSKKENEGF